jgi:hypothetical protein
MSAFRAIIVWTIDKPADLVAELLVVLLGTLVPVSAGVAAGVYFWKLVGEDIAARAPKTLTSILMVALSWAAGIYVAVVFGVAFAKLPAGIQRYLDGDAL